MNINQKLEKFRKLIKSKKKHCDYKRTVELSKEYKAHVSGVGLENYLKRFAKREDSDMFEQRKRLTNAISQSVAASLMKPFNKVSRNKNIKNKFNLKSDKVREDVVKKMSDGFYGTNELNTKGLDYWLRNRFIELTFTDPNAFLMIEWTPKPEDQVVEPYPYEISSENVFYYKYKNGVLNEIFSRQNEIMYYLDKDGVEQEKLIEAFTLYEIGSSIKIVEFDPKQFAAEGNVIDERYQMTYVEGKLNYLVTYNETKLDFIPAFRIGYMRDTATDGRTFVNPFESAMPYFRKALKAVSELDLSITLHTFPQKIMYAMKCQGMSKVKKCNGGFLADGSQCSKCKGSGYQLAGSGQDVLLLTLPDNPTKDDIVDLDKLIAYKTPPIELIKFQDEYVKGLATSAHLATYNSNQLLAYDPQFAKTATEVDSNTEGIYDTLFPYTEKYSEVWKTIMKIFVRISGFVGDFELIHIFPTDLRLKTMSVLMAELKTANESEAPSYFRDGILEEIANQIYEGDELGRLKHFTRHKFYPFSGKTETEIQFLMASSYVSNFTKVLYANFEAIFTDIEKAVPNFYKMKYDQQWETLNEYAKPYVDEITAQSGISLDLNWNTEDPQLTEEEKAAKAAEAAAEKNKANEETM
jgi:hypothetical protein